MKKADFSSPSFVQVNLNRDSRNIRVIKAWTFVQHEGWDIQVAGNAFITFPGLGDANRGAFWISSLQGVDDDTAHPRDLQADAMRLHRDIYRVFISTFNAFAPPQKQACMKNMRALRDPRHSLDILGNYKAVKKAKVPKQTSGPAVDSAVAVDGASTAAMTAATGGAPDGADKATALDTALVNMSI